MPKSARGYSSYLLSCGGIRGSIPELVGISHVEEVTSSCWASSPIARNFCARAVAAATVNKGHKKETSFPWPKPLRRHQWCLLAKTI